MLLRSAVPLGLMMTLGLVGCEKAGVNPSQAGLLDDTTPDRDDSVFSASHDSFDPKIEVVSDSNGSAPSCSQAENVSNESARTLSAGSSSIASFPLTLKFSLEKNQKIVEELESKQLQFDYEQKPEAKNRFKQLFERFTKQPNPEEVNKALRSEKVIAKMSHVIFDTVIHFDTSFSTLAKGMEACEGGTLYTHSAKPQETEFCIKGAVMPEHKITMMFIPDGTKFSEMLTDTDEGKVVTGEMLQSVLDELLPGGAESARVSGASDPESDVTNELWKKTVAAAKASVSDSRSLEKFPYLTIETSPVLVVNKAKSVCEMTDVNLWLRKPKVSCHRMGGESVFRNFFGNRVVGDLLGWTMQTLLGEMTVQPYAPRLEVLATEGSSRIKRFLYNRRKQATNLMKTISKPVVNKAIEVAVPVRNKTLSFVQSKLLSKVAVGFVQDFIGCPNTVADEIYHP